MQEYALTANRSVTTKQQYCCYYLAIYADFNIDQATGRLFQQYVVNSCIKVEGSRIAYIWLHQKDLRAKSYKQLIGFFHSDEEVGGIPVVVSTTFIGSSINKLQYYEVVLKMVAQFGQPDVFDVPEIQNGLKLLIS